MDTKAAAIRLHIWLISRLALTFFSFSRGKQDAFRGA